MPLQPNRNIAGLEKCRHGGFDTAEMESLGIDAADVLDFSISTNPFMPPPGIKKILNTISFKQYPDSEATGLRHKLSARTGIPPENILAGSGTTELIRLIALTYFKQNDTVLILEPTYGEYEIAGRIAGVMIIKHMSDEKNNFNPRINEVINIIKKQCPKALFVCNPNNPTGKYLSRSDIEALLEAMSDGLLILDEAYVAFMGNSWDSAGLMDSGNLIVLRSMTKDYGMPGLRLGYALAQTGIIDNLRLAAPPWNVNVVAQEVGAAVLENDYYLRQSLNQVKQATKYMVESFTGMGFTVLPSDAHYFLMKVGDAAQFRGSLLLKGIQVRDCTSFGIPEYVRISPRTMPECEKLVAAVASLVKSS